jgi:hypothetical protein
LLSETLEALMKRIEWFREALSSVPTADNLRERQAAGWRPVAIEWEREVEVQLPGHVYPGQVKGEIPFGMRIAADCRHLEDDPAEIEVLRALAEMVVQDLSFPRMADALNQRGLHTRDGHPWNAVDVFQLTPRLIEISPRILSGTEWETRKKQLTRVLWNS